jgi:predicted ATP-dependent endonuclease of OLD family
MKLIRAHVRNFQSVHDSTPFEVHDVTCLVGKNESGKTAILQALYRLNPIDPSDGRYDVTDDYPRTNVTAYEQEVAAGTRKPDLVVEATFQLDQTEASSLEADLGQEVLLDRAVTLVKGYENKLQYRLNASEAIAGKALLRKGNLLDQLQPEETTWKTLADLSKVLDKRAEAAKQAAHEQTVLANAKADEAEKAALLVDAKKLQEPPLAKAAREKIQAIIKQGLSSYIFSTYVEPNIPQFLYFDEYYQMRV